MKVCNECGGVGTIERDGKLYECICSFLRRAALAMPSYVRRTKVLPEHLTLPVIDMVNRSLYIISSWNDMKAVIKIIMIKHHNKHIKVTSDREIRDVFVGAMSRAARGDDDERIYNTLEDLMGPPDLMIVRLNEIHYKNKAAPGALLEAVSFRLDRDLPTWVISCMNNPFVKGSHAWSDSVADLFNTLTKVKINAILPVVSMESVLTLEPVAPSGTSLTPSKQKVYNAPKDVKKSRDPKKEQRKPREEQLEPVQAEEPEQKSEEDSGMLSLYGSGIEESKTNFRKR